jgi:hypothetical protein
MKTAFISIILAAVAQTAFAAAPVAQVRYQLTLYNQA